MYTILIVEDEPDVRENLKDLLEAENFNALTAQNGIEGYEIAMEKLPDLILSDIRMPFMDGLRLLQLLQEEKKTSTIPVILLSAKVEIEDLREGMNLGADDYITKPYKADELLKAINLRLDKKEKHYENILELKEKLLAHLSHELRTPLVGIIAFSDILENETEDLRLDDIKRMASVINKSGKRLHKKIERFLHYSELVALNMTANLNEAFDWYQVEPEILKKELADILKENLREADAKIFFESSKVKIHERFYLVILVELIENAIKFSKKGMEIVVEGFADGGFYKTKVFNKGLELDQLSGKKIDSFKRLYTDGGLSDGVGIGMELLKKTLKLYGGYLTIESNQNLYTTVEFGIPVTAS